MKSFALGTGLLSRKQRFHSLFSKETFMKKYLGNKLAIFLFIAPALLLFTVFIFIPIVQSLIYSFADWNGVKAANFTGVKNYIRLFGDKNFATANKNQLIFAVIITVYQMFLASVFAIAVSNTKRRFRKFFRVAFFIPVVLSVTVVCQLWMSVFNADTGLLNKLFAALGSDFSQNWLGERYKAIYVIAFVNAWQWMGYQFALIVAGIKSIPNDYYEAAQIDGASNLKAHLKITIPLLKETYKFCLIISLTGGIKAFTEMFIMTKGGPGTATYTLTYLMYTSAYKSKQYGYGMSAAVIMVLECMTVMLLINFIFRDRDEKDPFAKRLTRAEKKAQKKGSIDRRVSNES